jgi:hypothetical protein
MKLTVYQAVNTQRWSIFIPLLFINLSARWEWVINATPRPLYPR